MKDIEDRFAIIIKRFCTALALFIQVVNHPTHMSTDIIKKKKKRSTEFDQYVSAVDEFNNIIEKIISSLKLVIFALNNLFIYRSVDKLAEFLDKIRDFLMFLINDNVIMKLNELEEKLNRKYDNKINLVDKIGKIKCVIFRLFDISIDISSIFIPQLYVVKNVIFVLEQQSDIYLQNKINSEELSKINIDEITKQLLDVQLRSEIILLLNTEVFLSELNKKDFDAIIIAIENLQKDYVDMLQISISLKKEIDKYKTKDKNIFMFFKEIFSNSPVQNE